MKPVRLVTIPSSDVPFGEDARAMLVTVPAHLQEEAALRWFVSQLRATYPTAVVRPQEELARPQPDAETVWYAFRRQYRSRISKSLVVPLRVEDAFSLYTAQVTVWQSAVELTPVVITGSLIGDEYDACYRLLGQEFHGRFRIVDAKPPRSVTTEAGGSGIRVWYMTTFAPAGEGTTVRVEGDYDLPEGIVPRIADRLFIERSIERDIEAAHSTFVALCHARARELARREAGEGSG